MKTPDPRWLSAALGAAWLWCAACAAPHAARLPLPPPATSAPETVLLWPAGAPEAQGAELGDQPSVTAYRPAPGLANGTAVIVNPGGGYRVLVADNEGQQVARWLNRAGITAFVLRYRLTPRYAPEVALRDGQRAVKWVRHHAGRFGVSARRIGMLGFSAGANLATAVATQLDEGDAAAPDPTERVSARPDFIVPVYPAISRIVLPRGNFIATDGLVTPRTPPAFLVHTHEDKLLPLHSVRFYEALLAAGVPAALHVFGHGPHGIGLGTGDPDLAQWCALFLQWLRRERLLTDAERVAVTGQVMIDGQPLHFGWVTLLPEDPRHPIAAMVVNGKQKGVFSFDARHGPVMGRYRAQIHVMSAPGGDLVKGEVTIPDSIAYTQASPGNPAPLSVTIAQGQAPLAIKITTR